MFRTLSEDFAQLARAGRPVAPEAMGEEFFVFAGVLFGAQVHNARLCKRYWFSIMILPSIEPKEKKEAPAWA
jgi:hypothetical protein